MRTEDGYIIYKCLNGEPEAFGLLVEKYKVGVYAFVLAKLHNFQDAQDVAQDVFIKAYYNLHKLKRWDSFAAWLYRIALNSCKNKLKAESKRPDREFVEDHDQETLDKPSIESYRDNTLCESVREALDSLPETYQQVLTMRYVGGMNSVEIANALGISPTNVRYRLSKAREQLKEEVLPMMSASYEQNKLHASFTIRIVEAVKRIRVHPLSTAKGLPWGISLVAGVIFGVLSLGPGIKLHDLMPAPMSSPLPEKSSVIMTGEFPLNLLMGPEMSLLSGKQGNGSGGESNLPTRQNAFSLAPKGEEYTFVRSWPEEILGLRNPSGVVVDSSGNAYVTDTGNSRIQKFDSNGNPLMKWGSEGSGDGQFNYPHGIAIDSDGNIYVVDSNNHRIQKFDSEGNFLMKWGTQGPDDGQFGWSYGITIDSSGNIYVISGYSRIQKFDSQGKFLMKWGSEGAGDGQFSWFYGIAVDNSGNIYVADTGNNRIQKFDSNGNFLMKWGSEGSGDGQFKWPYGIVVDSSGNVYVTDQQNSRIQKFDLNGKFLAKWGVLGFGDGQFNYADGIAVDGSGKVYVADANNHRIQKFDPDGKLLMKLGTEGITDGQLQSPSRVAIDSFGNVYVTEEISHRIQKFDSKGNFLLKWGTYGSGDGQFNKPVSVAIDSVGNVYVADCWNHRIQKFDSNGKYLKKWGSQGEGDGQFLYPGDIAINKSGDIYVADQNRIQKFDSNGRFLLKWGSWGQGDGQFQVPIGIAIDSSGSVYVADCNNHRIQKFDSKGNFLMKWGFQGNSDGEFRWPWDIATDSDDSIYVADTDNYRIQKFNKEGKFIAKWGSYGSGDMKFKRPEGVAVSNSGYVYVTDWFAHCIKVYRSPGWKSVDSGSKQPTTWGQVKKTELYQNYPNPFNPETWIPYQLGEDTRVEIRIYTSDGQLIRTLNLGRKQAGTYTSKEKSAYWDGKNEAGEHVSSGIYFYTIQAGDYSDTKKMILIE
jgi:RNA polymerase sigma factor (sigma-70 family)